MASSSAILAAEPLLDLEQQLGELQRVESQPLADDRLILHLDALEELIVHDRQNLFQLGPDLLSVH